MAYSIIFLGKLHFVNVPPDSAVELFNEACYFDGSIKQLTLAGKRSWNLKRVMDFRLGLRCNNDRSPKSLLQQFLDNPAGLDNFVPDLYNMLKAYYEAWEWNPYTGYSTEDTLQSIGLEWIMEN